MSPASTPNANCVELLDPLPKGILEVHRDPSNGGLDLEYDPSETPEKELSDTLEQKPASDAGTRWETLLMIVCGLSLAAGLTLEQLEVPSLYRTLVWTAAYLTGGYFGVVAGLKSLWERVVDVDLLMVLAALGAAWIGHPFEGGMLLFLFALSNVLQNHALDRSRQAVRALMRLRPDRVTCRVDGAWTLRPVDDLVPGDRVLVKPGESVALDGVVDRGESAVDESSITGESIPVAKAGGDRLYAGTLNQGGSLEYTVTKCASDSTLAKVVAMVEDAQAQKASTQRFLEKAEQHYALGVILLTLGLIVVPWRFFGADFSANFYRAMTVMVVASPCALVISTPAAFLSAIGGAARKGVLFKGGVHLERLADVDVVAFDKTGTLTRGKPVVTEIVSLSGDRPEVRDELLRRVASVESHSEHPLARAVLEAARGARLTLPEPEGFRSIAGKGAAARVDGRPVVVGSLGYFQERGVPIPDRLDAECRRLQEMGRSIILAAEGGEDDSLRLLGLVAVADEVRPEAAETVRQLKATGIRRVAMLTGDHPRVAAHIAGQLGIDEVFAGLMPADKVEVVRKLERIGPVAMVGDGVNDAPALATAHVGIAMGAAGTDVAMETADVVLMSDNLHHLVNAFRLARRGRRVVTQNLVFALGVILVLVVSALSVGIPLPLGVIGHEGSTVLVCLNGLRLLRFRTA